MARRTDLGARIALGGLADLPMQQTLKGVFFSCYFSLGRATGFELGVVDRKLVTLVIPRLLFTFNNNLFSVFESVHAAGR